MTILHALCGLLLSQSGAKPIYKVCLAPSGAVSVVRGGVIHTPHLFEFLLSGDKVICGPASTLTCFDTATRGRVVFQSKSTVVVEGVNLRKKSGPAPLRLTQSSFRGVSPGYMAGMISSRSGAQETRIEPRDAQRAIPVKLTWTLKDGPSPTGIDVRILAPNRVGGRWDTSGGITRPVFAQTLPPTASEAALVNGVLDAGVPYVAEITVTRGDVKEVAKARFWVLDASDLDAIGDAERAAAANPSFEARSMLAFVYSEAGLFRDALKVYQALLGERPGDAELSRTVAQIKVQAGDSK